MAEVNNIIPRKILDTYSLSENGIPYSDLIPKLKENFGGIPFEGKDTFMNIPVTVNPVQLNDFSRLSKLLDTVLQKIVLNYFNDKRIRDIYQLDADLEAILQQAANSPYKVGMYRPDFILDENGQPKICEIGCRYPINGWMFSHYTRRIFDNLAPFINNWAKFSDQNPLIKTISADFNSNKTLFYIHDLEGGTEAYQFFNELKKQGFIVKDISSKDLEIHQNKLVAKGEPAEQFIIEMDREELKNIKPEIRQALIDSKKCLNDLRTLILVHDKRVLSVLFDEHIMRDYVDEDDYNFLKQFLIPSYILDSEKRRNELINTNTNWLLKKNSGGRGIGIYVKNDCNAETWKNAITNEWQQYMVQEYITQKTVNLTHHKTTKSINIVGMLLCYNGQSFGPGIFRGSSKSIINVHSGGYILPTVITN